MKLVGPAKAARASLQSRGESYAKETDRSGRCWPGFHRRLRSKPTSPSGVADASSTLFKYLQRRQRTGNTTRVSTNSSLIGFKGAESLGNGLTAVFQYESGVGFDNTGALGATRDSFVGLAGGFGTVVLGNLTGPTCALGAAVTSTLALPASVPTPRCSASWATTCWAPPAPPAAATPRLATPMFDRNTTCTSIFDTRWKNAIAYVSPTFAGLNVTAAYVANENKTFNNNGFGTAYNPSNTKGYDVGLKYANGPAMAAVTYNAVSLGNEANTDVSDFRVGGVYDFGMASVRAVFDRARADHFGGNTVTQNVFGLGGTFNVTPAGKLLAQAFRS